VQPLPIAAAHWAQGVRRRAEQHAATRPQRWRILGFDVPSRSAAPRAGGGEWPRVSIVLATHRPAAVDNCRRNILAQDYPNLEAIIVLNNDASDETHVREMFAAMPHVSVLRLPQARNLGACVNLGTRAAAGAYVTKMDDDDFYGPSYISDLLLSALESRADITGKKATFFHFEDGDEYCLRSPALRHTWLWPISDSVGCCIVPPSFSPHGSNVAGATIFVKRDLLLRFPFDEQAPRSTDSLFQLACRRAGATIYAADEFNFCYQRRAGNDGHLWRVTKDMILNGAHLLPGFDCDQVCV
jgi:glycosyltransferase involved in cell wall biosynthesis